MSRIDGSQIDKYRDITLIAIYYVELPNSTKYVNHNVCLTDVLLTETAVMLICRTFSSTRMLGNRRSERAALGSMLTDSCLT